MEKIKELQHKYVNYLRNNTDVPSEVTVYVMSLEGEYIDLSKRNKELEKHNNDQIKSIYSLRLQNNKLEKQNEELTKDLFTIAGLLSLSAPLSTQQEIMYKSINSVLSNYTK